MEQRAVFVSLTREAEVKLAETDLTSGQIPFTDSRLPTR
jgi:hypothetical protein